MHFLQIDVGSGALRIRKELDFEKQHFFNLTVQAEDRGIPSLSSQTFVEVEVRNIHTQVQENVCHMQSLNRQFEIHRSVD